MLKRLLLLVFFAIISFVLRAQDTAAENKFIDTATQYAVASYYRYIDKQSRLYNGIQHFRYAATIKDFAYFLTTDWQTGSVLYDGLLYQDVPMLYDLYTDEVMIRHYNGLTIQSLLSEKVKEFRLANHHFIRFERDSLASSAMGTGFYDLLYEGKVWALVKRTKILKEKITYQLEQEFVEQDHYFLLKDGIYHPVKSFVGLMDALDDKSNEIRQYLKKNKLKFRKTPEYALLEAARYYDSLKK